MATACKHPKVRIVSRHDDSEFVECLECGEIFDSEEFRDMEIEETAGTEREQSRSWEAFWRSALRARATIRLAFQ